MVSSASFRAEQDQDPVPDWEAIDDPTPGERWQGDRDPGAPQMEELLACSFSSDRRLRAVSFFEPSRPVFHNPINQGPFKTYVVASFLAFNPFVTKDLSAFG
jgi:hypothetical protein